MTNPKLTDAEVEVLFAERVLGLDKNSMEFFTRAGILKHRPLTSIADAMAGLEVLAHTHKWCCIAIRYDYDYRAIVTFTPCGVLNETETLHEPTVRMWADLADQCRTITYACLLAVGACMREELP